MNNILTAELIPLGVVIATLIYYAKNLIAGVWQLAGITLAVFLLGAALGLLLESTLPLLEVSFIIAMFVISYLGLKYFYGLFAEREKDKERD